MLQGCQFPSYTDFWCSLTSLSSCFIGAMFAMLFESYMNFLMVFCKWSLCNWFISAMFAMVFNSVMYLLLVILFYLLCGYNVCNGIWHIHAPTFGEFFLWFPICSWFIISEIFARVLDSLMYWLLEFFKISLCSCSIAAMFARVLDSFTHWLLVFFIAL